MSDELPLISVIVPVYNVEDYVEECVRSLIAQDYPNVEILLIDDGSTDASGCICDNLAGESECVSVYHKENGGPSEARNYGLVKSRGSWISFVDSDDYASPIFLSTLYAATRVFDCPMAAIPGGYDFHDGDKVSLAEKISLVATEMPLGCRQTIKDSVSVGVDAPCVTVMQLGTREALKMLLYQQMDTGPQWRLYRRDTLGKDPFPKGLYYEDLASIYKFVYRAGVMALVDCRDLYAYRLRSTSIIRQAYRHVKGYSAIAVASQLYADITEWYPELAVACSSRCFSVCRMVFGQVPSGKDATEQDKQDREALWRVLVANRDVVAADPDARRRERLAARIAQLGEGPFTAFCYLARKLGQMR